MHSLYQILSDSSRKNADMAVNLIKKEPKLFDDFFYFALKDEPHFSMWAARVLAFVANKNPKLVAPYILSIIKALPKIKNDGLKRGFVKILSEYEVDINDKTLGELVDQCFRWLNSSNEKVALKVYSMELLFQICQKIPELKSEFIASIEDQMEKGGGAINSKGKDILNKL